MANSEHVRILKNGVERWNEWRRENLESTKGFIEIDLSGCDLRRMNLKCANLNGVNLTDAILNEADLSESSLAGATLVTANLNEADLGEANLTGADLREASLIGASLVSANIRNGKLSKSDLSRVNLMGANLNDSDLVAANLQGADLRFANLSDADLSEANLAHAILHFALLSETLLEKTIANEVRFGKTSISDTDLSTVVNLETGYHFSSSSIDHLSLKRSGELPELFLRGIGLHDWEIEQTKLYRQGLSNAEINEIVYNVYDYRATQTIRIGPMFISYTHSDCDFVDRLGALLTQKGIRYWRDIKDLKAGRLEKQVDRAMKLNDLVVIVLSKESVESDWVEHEVKKARKIEKKAGKDLIVPIALDDEWKTCRWPERLREQIEEYQVLDFSGSEDKEKLWKQFANLLNGIDLFYQ